MILFPLFKLAGKSFWLVGKVIFVARNLATIQSIILVPLVAILLLLPLTFDRQREEARTTSPLPSAPITTQPNYQGDRNYLPLSNTGFTLPRELGVTR